MNHGNFRVIRIWESLVGCLVMEVFFLVDLHNYLSYVHVLDKAVYNKVMFHTDNRPCLTIEGLPSGTTDVAIVLSQAARERLPSTGIRMIFELKKRVGGAKERYQTLISLLLANEHSSNLKPVAVLTDLRADYTFYWLDGREIFYYTAESSGHALGIISKVLTAERVTERAHVVPVEVRLSNVVGLCVLIFSSMSGAGTHDLVFKANT